MATNKRTIEEGITEQEIADAIEADGRYLEYKQTWRYKVVVNLYYPIYRFWRDITDIPKAIKAFWQRGRRGWADSDAWSIVHYLDSFMPELLRHMIDDTKGGGNGYPGEGSGPEADTAKHWQATVKKIARGFEASREQDNLWQNDKFKDMKAHRKEYDRLNKIKLEGMTLFVKYYNHLWD